MKRKEVKKLSPLSVKELSSISRLCSTFGIIRKGMPNNNGTFSHVKLTSDKPFKRDEINSIINWFKIDYNETLIFQSNKIGEIFVGTLSKLA